MLILTRKIEEGITIDGQILVKILGVDGNKVRVGIAAPKEIEIMRSELTAPPKPANHQPKSKQ